MTIAGDIMLNIVPSSQSKTRENSTKNENSTYFAETFATLENYGDFLHNMGK